MFEMFKMFMIYLTCWSDWWDSLLYPACYFLPVASLGCDVIPLANVFRDVCSAAASKLGHWAAASSVNTCAVRTACAPQLPRTGTNTHLTVTNHAKRFTNPLLLSIAPLRQLILQASYEQPVVIFCQIITLRKWACAWYHICGCVVSWPHGVIFIKL